MATDFSDSLQDATEELSHRAQERSAKCVDLSELSEVVEEHGLSDDEGQALQETLEQRGLEVRDDCGRERVDDTRYINGEMAERKIGRVQRELQARLGREPTDAEVAAEAKLSEREVREAKDAARVVTSLDRPVGEEEDTSLGALIPSGERSPEEEVEIALQQDAVRSALDRLPEREREVVRLRYGIDGDDPTPLREAGRRLGISSEEVRRLERRALAELAESRELEALRPAA